MQVIITPVCRRLLESLSSKEPWQLAASFQIRHLPARDSLWPQHGWSSVALFSVIQPYLRSVALRIKLIPVSFFHTCPEATLFQLSIILLMRLRDDTPRRKERAQSTLSISRFLLPAVLAFLVRKPLKVQEVCYLHFSLLSLSLLVREVQQNHVNL